MFSITCKYLASIALYVFCVLASVVPSNCLWGLSAVKTVSASVVNTSGDGAATSQKFRFEDLRREIDKHRGPLVRVTGVGVSEGGGVDTDVGKQKSLRAHPLQQLRAASEEEEESQEQVALKEQQTMMEIILYDQQHSYDEQQQRLQQQQEQQRRRQEQQQQQQQQLNAHAQRVEGATRSEEEKRRSEGTERNRDEEKSDIECCEDTKGDKEDEKEGQHLSEPPDAVCGYRLLQYPRIQSAALPPSKMLVNSTIRTPSYLSLYMYISFFLSLSLSLSLSFSISLSLSPSRAHTPLSEVTGG